LIYYVIAFIVFLIDQATKWLIATNYKLHETHNVIGEFFQLTSHRNKGAAFGILENQRWFFIIITTVVVVGIIWYLQSLLKSKRKLLPFALSLVLGGALGNFLDRALHGEVVDFFQFNFNFGGYPYTFPIFNVADSGIVVGVALIFLDALIGWRKEKQGAVENDTQQQQQGN